MGEGEEPLARRIGVFFCASVVYRDRQAQHAQLAQALLLHPVVPPRRRTVTGKPTMHSEPLGRSSASCDLKSVALLTVFTITSWCARCGECCAVVRSHARRGHAFTPEVAMSLCAIMLKGTILLCNCTVYYA